jgi:3-oxoacyl-[acyl-carrier protein] reductase
MLLNDRVALVTGAATGIGEGVARLFAAQGARVFLLDRDGALNSSAAATIQNDFGYARAFECDVRNRGAVQQAVAAALAEWGRLDILINNAGIYPRQRLVDMTEEQWDEMQDTNLKSVFHCTKAVLPHMVGRRSGKIVNISSVTFFKGTRNLSHYVAAKGGVIGFTRSVAREVGEHNVHVNCITPGAILVEREKRVATDEEIRQIVALQSLPRRLLPVDIARVCVFLSSEWSDGMTGQTLNVDGGLIMH